MLPLGSITAAVTFNPTSSEGLLPVASRSAATWAPPWAYVGLLVLLVLGVVLAVLIRRRRRLPALEPSPA